MGTQAYALVVVARGAPTIRARRREVKKTGTQTNANLVDTGTRGPYVEGHLGEELRGRRNCRGLFGGLTERRTQATQQLHAIEQGTDDFLVMVRCARDVLPDM